MKRASRPFSALAVLGLVGLTSFACTPSAGPDDVLNPGAGGGPAQTGGAASTAGSGTGVGAAGATAGGGSGPVDLSMGGPKLRILTEVEYRNSVTDLLGTINAKLALPADTSVAGFVAIGAAQVTINASAVELYEAASRAVTAEVFGDAARWQKLVGCQPKADLSDACVDTFVRSFGKRAFRRALTDAEVTQWLNVGKEAAQLASDPALGLSTLTSGLLQSPYFLYRVETNKLDATSGRLRYDGPSMATRLAFLLTGRAPTDALVNAGAMGQLDTVEGIRAAATPLLNDASTVNRMAEFFGEFSQADLVMVVQKSAEMFPTFNATLKSSMLQATQLFIKNVVLAPSADVRTFFDSDQTFVDANLAPLYGVSPPASGFAQIKLAPETGRAGILGQAAVLAGHSQPDHNSPTRRGVFISGSFLCLSPPPPPPGILTDLPNDPTLTERQRLDVHRTNPSCAACHALFDPYGFALEHFDSIGQYRATEHGLTIDATGTLDGKAFDGAAQLGAALRENQRAMKCMMGNFYRSANGIVDATTDAAQVEALGQALTAKGYVWRDFLAEFVVSDAFRSAPAVAVAAGGQ
jgi:Protein of unknown function (DUF1588)/Protein of unknown function (DUF1592)/Protein of unknown function (DUF1595)/Protein of unknown function (DUF1587)/Protein of unknown function (DUF1585)